MRLVSRGPAEFQRGVAEYFVRAYPGQVAVGFLRRADVRDPSWFDSVFRSAVGPLRTGVADGYYLFEQGLVVGHHGGVIRPANVRYGEGDLDEQRARVIEHGFGGVGARADVVEGARQIIVYFDGIVLRKLRAAGMGDADRYVRQETPGPSARRPPPPRPPRRPDVPGDPFAILGLAKTAKLAEVKAAYRAQMKLNHPDKVSHLSPALQKFAETQVLEIKRAYDALLLALGD